GLLAWLPPVSVRARYRLAQVLAGCQTVAGGARIAALGSVPAHGHLAGSSTPVGGTLRDGLEAHRFSTFRGGSAVCPDPDRRCDPLSGGGDGCGDRGALLDWLHGAPIGSDGRDLLPVCHSCDPAGA